MPIGRQIAYAEVITPRQYQVSNSLASCLIRRDSSIDYPYHSVPVEDKGCLLKLGISLESAYLRRNQLK